MFIHLNTDHNIRGTAELQAEVESVLKSDLGRFDDRITTLEVHLNDTNSHKRGPLDKRCQIEARIKGMKAVSVTHADASISQALNGASEKLMHVLDSTIGEMTFRSRRKAHVEEFLNSQGDNALDEMRADDSEDSSDTDDFENEGLAAEDTLADDDSAAQPKLT